MTVHPTIHFDIPEIGEKFVVSEDNGDMTGKEIVVTAYQFIGFSELDVPTPYRIFKVFGHIPGETEHRCVTYLAKA